MRRYFYAFDKIQKLSIPPDEELKKIVNHFNEIYRVYQKELKKDLQSFKKWNVIGCCVSFLNTFCCCCKSFL